MQKQPAAVAIIAPPLCLIDGQRRQLPDSPCHPPPIPIPILKYRIVANDGASVSIPAAPLRRLASSIVTRSASCASTSSHPSPAGGCGGCRVRAVLSARSRIPRSIFHSIRKCRGSHTSGPIKLNGGRDAVSARRRINSREPPAVGSSTNAQLQSKYPGSVRCGGRSRRNRNSSINRRKRATARCAGIRAARSIFRVRWTGSNWARS